MAVSAIEPFTVRQYLGLRFALNTDQIALIIAANPSTLIQFAERLSADQYQLIGDLFDGTTRGICELPKSFRTKYQTNLCHRDRRRAQKLEQIAKIRPLKPSDLWPALEVLGTWTGGHAAHYLTKLRSFYPGVTLRDHGLSATEGHITIPYSDESDRGILNIHGGFFEFIEEASCNQLAPQTVMARDLTKGSRYEVVLSTYGGLLRYRMHDLVECTGFYMGTPVLKFIAKSDLFANIAGEKLSLWQASEAMNQVKAKSGLAVDEYLFSASLRRGPHYVCYVEEPADFMTTDFAAIAQDLDACLQDINSEYRDKRRTQRLLALRVEVVPPHTFDKLRTKKLQTGVLHPEQYKHPFLINDQELDTFIAAFSYAPFTRQRALS
jgi:hypothetical protein